MAFVIPCSRNSATENSAFSRVEVDLDSTSTDAEGTPDLMRRERLSPESPLPDTMTSGANPSLNNSAARGTRFQFSPPRTMTACAFDGAFLTQRIPGAKKIAAP